MTAILLLAASVWEPAHLSRLEPVLRAAVELRRDDPAAVSELGRYLVEQGRPREGESWIRRAISIRPRAEEMETLAGLGVPDAVDLLSAAVEIRQNTGAGDPLARTLVALGTAMESRGEVAGAEAVYRKAIVAAEKGAGQALGVACNDLGLLLENRQDFPGAEKLYRRALAAHEKAVGARHPETATTLNNLAGVVGAQGRMAEAEVLLRRAVRAFESTLGVAHPMTANAAANLGDLLSATLRKQEARRFYQQAIDAFERLGDARSVTDIQERERR